MSQIDYQHIMQFQRQVEEGEVIYKPDPEDDNGYFLEHGGLPVDKEALIRKHQKKIGLCINRPRNPNAPNLILKVPWAVGSGSSKV